MVNRSQNARKISRPKTSTWGQSGAAPRAKSFPGLVCIALLQNMEEEELLMVL